jgi:hypothetical protein
VPWVKPVKLSKTELLSLQPVAAESTGNSNSINLLVIYFNLQVETNHNVKPFDEKSKVSNAQTNQSYSFQDSNVPPKAIFS